MDKETLLKEIEKLEHQINVINNTWNFNKPYSQYERNMTPLWESLNKKNAELNLIEEEIQYNSLEDGDLFTLNEFIDMCKDGSFIDSDGHGYYATAKNESSIQVKPSWIMMNKYRKDFDYVNWYNK